VPFERHVGEEDRATRHGDINGRASGLSVHEANVSFAAAGRCCCPPAPGLNVWPVDQRDDRIVGVGRQVKVASMTMGSVAPVGLTDLVGTGCQLGVGSYALYGALLKATVPLTQTSTAGASRAWTTRMRAMPSAPWHWWPGPD